MSIAFVLFTSKAWLGSTVAGHLFLTWVFGLPFVLEPSQLATIHSGCRSCRAGKPFLLVIIQSPVWLNHQSPIQLHSTHALSMFGHYYIRLKRFVGWFIMFVTHRLNPSRGLSGQMLFFPSPNPTFQRTSRKTPNSSTTADAQLSKSGSVF